ncbi:MAG: hypothetical protein ACR2PT_14765 [Endozoicomonas sp.]
MRKLVLLFPGLLSTGGAWLETGVASGLHNSVLSYQHKLLLDRVQFLYTEGAGQAEEKATKGETESWTSLSGSWGLSTSDHTGAITIVLCTKEPVEMPGEWFDNYDIISLGMKLQPDFCQHTLIRNVDGSNSSAVMTRTCEQRYRYRIDVPMNESSFHLPQVADLDPGCTSVQYDSHFAFLKELEKSDEVCSPGEGLTISTIHQSAASDNSTTGSVPGIYSYGNGQSTSGSNGPDTGKGETAGPATRGAQGGCLTGRNSAGGGDDEPPPPFSRYVKEISEGDPLAGEKREWIAVFKLLFEEDNNKQFDILERLSSTMSEWYTIWQLDDLTNWLPLKRWGFGSVPVTKNGEVTLGSDSKTVCNTLMKLILKDTKKTGVGLLINVLAGFNPVDSQDLKEMFKCELGLPDDISAD